VGGRGQAARNIGLHEQRLIWMGCEKKREKEERKKKESERRGGRGKEERACQFPLTKIKGTHIRPEAGKKKGGKGKNEGRGRGARPMPPFSKTRFAWGGTKEEKIRRGRKHVWLPLSFPREPVVRKKKKKKRKKIPARCIEIVPHKSSAPLLLDVTFFSTSARKKKIIRQAKWDMSPRIQFRLA